MSICVAIITASPTCWETLSQLISSCGLTPVHCSTLANTVKRAAQQHFDLAICEEDLPDGTFEKLITDLRALGKHTPVIVVSQFHDWKDDLEVMLAGAYDYIAFPLAPQELDRAVAAALTEDWHHNGTNAPLAA
jgi:two-component system, NtrC family, response regulator PilR